MEFTKIRDIELDQTILSNLKTELKINDRLNYSISSKKTITRYTNIYSLFVNLFYKKDMLLCFVFEYTNKDYGNNEYIFKTLKNKTNLDLDDDIIKQIINDLSIHINNNLDKIIR